jgi:hypothetical protein
MAEVFTDSPAVREELPTMVGLIGPSSSGKTYSALRLATGFQRVQGGDIFVIDTEAKRSLRYADKFKFRHVPFAAPFGPLRYLAAFEYAIGKGAKHIVVDSMSHEHESTGGVLEMHAAEVKRLSRGDASKAEGVKMLAWAKPKLERRLMINAFMQMRCNFIFCYRAKEKLEIKRGQNPVALGYMPLGAEEMIFEMSLNCLLHPMANGFPTWEPTEPGEKQIVKLPQEYRDIFASKPQLSEDVGEKMARWASAGVTQRTPTADELISRLSACVDSATLRILESERGAAWAALAKADKVRVKAAADEAKSRVEAAELAALDATPDPDADDDDVPDFDDDEKREIARQEAAANK